MSKLDKKLFNCKFCNKYYTTKYILKNHQNTSKKCLSLHSSDKIIVKFFNCNICGYISSIKCNIGLQHTCRPEYIKIFNDNIKLKKTINTLETQHEVELKKSDDEVDRLLSLDMNNELYFNETIEKYKKETEKKIDEIKKDCKEQIKVYQDRMFDLASKPHLQVVKNNTTHNTLQVHIDKLDVVVYDEFKDHESKLILDHIENGIKGFAKFTLDHPLKNKLVTSDVPRRMIKWKNEDENVITDPYGKTLAPKLFSAFFPRYACLHNELGDNITNNPLLTDEQKSNDRVRYGEYIQGFKNIMRGEACGDSMRDIWTGELAKSTALTK